MEATQGQKLRTKKRLHDLRTGRINAPNDRHGQNVLMIGEIMSNRAEWKSKRREMRRKKIEARIAEFQRRRRNEHRAKA